MKLTILNRLALRNYEPDKSSILIRISSKPLLPLKGSFSFIYNFYFDDCYEGDYVMSNEEASEIINILKFAHIGYKELVISCDYAVGISPAVAIFYDENFNEGKLNLKEKYRSFNGYVLSKLESLWEK